MDRDGLGVSERLSLIEHCFDFRKKFTQSLYERRIGEKDKRKYDMEGGGRGGQEGGGNVQLFEINMVLKYWTSSSLIIKSD